MKPGRGKFPDAPPGQTFRPLKAWPPTGRSAKVRVPFVTRTSRAMAQAPQEVLIALRRIMRATDLYSKQLSKTAGLTSPQLLILAAIARMGDVTIGTIAREVKLSQATVTTILDRLERRGLVYRERSTVDKRKVHAHLTAEGEEALSTAPTPLQQSFIARYEGLDPWEQSMILASLQRVADMMDAGDLDASPMLHVGTIDPAMPPA
jgi:DNA-binding MarR family transcriptional regulator